MLGKFVRLIDWLLNYLFNRDDGKETEIVRRAIFSRVTVRKEGE